MIIPCNINVLSVANDVRTLYAIYMHKNIDGVVEYVGVTPLTELFSFTDAECNSLWSETFTKGRNIGIEIVVMGLTPSEPEAFIEQRKLIAQYQPRCNKMGYWIDPKYQVVQCDQTGETWPNINAACKAHNLTYSALFNHLKRKPGYKSVKGRTYSRVMPQRKRDW